MNAVNDQQASDPHDDGGQHDAQENRQDAGLEIHIQNARSQGSRPGPGSGEGDADEQHKGDEQALGAGLFLKLEARLMALFQAPGEEGSDDLLSAPHSSTLRAKKKITGTGSIFPTMQTR